MDKTNRNASHVFVAANIFMIEIFSILLIYELKAKTRGSFGWTNDCEEFIIYSFFLLYFFAVLGFVSMHCGFGRMSDETGYS